MFENPGRRFHVEPVSRTGGRLGSLAPTPAVCLIDWIGFLRYVVRTAMVVNHILSRPHERGGPAIQTSDIQARPRL